MKRASVLGLLIPFIANDVAACCPSIREATLLGWSRDETKAVVLLAPDADGAPPPEIRLLDVPSGRTLERHRVDPWEIVRGCGLDTAQKSPDTLRALIRLTKIAAVAPTRFREHPLRAAIETKDWGTQPHVFSVLDPYEERSVLDLKGPFQGPIEYSVGIQIVPSPSGRYAALFASGDCGTFALPRFITRAQLRRLDSIGEGSETSGARPHRDHGWQDYRYASAAPDAMRVMATPFEPSEIVSGTLVAWSPNGRKALALVYASDDKGQYQLYDTKTGRVIEALPSFDSPSSMEPCSWDVIQRDPTWAKTVLRFARIASVKAVDDGENWRETYTSPDGRRVAWIDEDGVPRFMTRAEFARLRRDHDRKAAGAAIQEPTGSGAVAGAANQGAGDARPHARDAQPRASAVQPRRGDAPAGTRDTLCVSPDDAVVLAKQGEAVLPSVPLTLQADESTIVWAGDWGGFHDRLGRWIDVPLRGAPPTAPRCTAVWTGTEMILWNDLPLGPVGGRFDPTIGQWESMSKPDLPLFGRAVWTGLEMLVWDPALTTGGVYDPSSDIWSLIRAAGAPPFGPPYTVLYVGSGLIVVGESNDPAWLYDVAEDRWRRVSVRFSSDCPEPTRPE